MQGELVAACPDRDSHDWDDHGYGNVCVHCEYERPCPHVFQTIRTGDDGRICTGLACIRSECEHSVTLDEYQAMERDEPCVICQQPIANKEAAFLLQCAHVYHRECISTWRAMNLQTSNYFQCCKCRMPTSAIVMHTPQLVGAYLPANWKTYYENNALDIRYVVQGEHSLHLQSGDSQPLYSMMFRHEEEEQDEEDEEQQNEVVIEDTDDDDDDEYVPLRQVSVAESTMSTRKRLKVTPTGNDIDSAICIE